MKITFVSVLFLFSFSTSFAYDEIQDLMQLVEKFQGRPKTCLVLDVNGTIADAENNYFPLGNSQVFIELSKENGTPVVCLTDTNPAEMPQQHMIEYLKGHQISLSSLEGCRGLSRISRLGATYLDGIIYAGSTATKGKIIAALFEPGDEIVFVDDSQEHVISVDLETTCAGIACASYLLSKQ